MLKKGTSKFLILFIVLYASLMNAQTVKWTDIETATESQEVKAKKIFLKIDRADCKDCERLSFTLAQPKVVATLIKHFYCVKSDGNSNDLDHIISILKSRSNKNYEGLKQITKNIKNGDIKLPVIVFINEELEIIQKFEGFRDALSIEKITLYFGKDYYKKVFWNNFNKNYKEYGNR